jgi:hypothetical protein
MKFLISRTSVWDEAKQPYEKAYRDKYIQVDTRKVDDPKKLKLKVDWYSEGKNHRVENRYIKRDFESTGWFIDLETLEDLIKLKNEVGDIVIQSSFQNEEITEIEIYDGYRE